MKIRECMTTDVTSISPSDNLHDAARLMWEHDCGVLPVIDQNQTVVGMITDRDIAMAAYTQGRQLGEIRVEQAKSGSLCSCTADQDLGLAERMMQEHQVRRLPVCDEAGRLVGIISLNDIALAYRQGQGRQVRADEVAQTLASVSNHRMTAAAPAA